MNRAKRAILWLLVLVGLTQTACAPVFGRNSGPTPDPQIRAVIEDLSRVCADLDTLIADASELRASLKAQLPGTLSLFAPVSGRPFDGPAAAARKLSGLSADIRARLAPLTLQHNARLRRVAEDLDLFCEQVDSRAASLQRMIAERAELYASLDAYRALELSEGPSGEPQREADALAQAQAVAARLREEGRQPRMRWLAATLGAMLEQVSGKNAGSRDALRQAARRREYQNAQRDLEAWYRATNTQTQQLCDTLLADIAAGAAYLTDAKARVEGLRAEPYETEADAALAAAYTRTEQEAGDMVAMGRAGFPNTLVADLTAPDQLYPAYYESAAAPFTVMLHSAKPIACLVSVEVQGMTQVTEQVVTVGPGTVSLDFRPPLLTELLRRAPAAFGAQLVVTVKRNADGAVLSILTRDILVHAMTEWNMASVYNLHDNCDYLAAFVTPEDVEVRKWHREAIDRIEEMTDYALSGLYGYQLYGGLSVRECVRAQIQALFETLFYDHGVRYNSAVASASEGAETVQRVSFPRMVLAEGIGVCVDTTLAMAAALEALDMNVFLLQSDTHTFLMVEAEPGSGEYFAVETTMLTEALLGSAISEVRRGDLPGFLERQRVERVIDLRRCRNRGIRAVAVEWDAT